VAIETGPDLLTVAEVGRRLTVSPRTVERLIEAGTLRIVRVSPKARRIKRTELEAYLERQGA
jgi:excisionase family DNA binding protein